MDFNYLDEFWQEHLQSMFRWLYSKLFHHEKSLAYRVNRKLKQLRHRANRFKVISLKTKGVPLGNVLFSYVVEAFLLDLNDPYFASHTNLWEARQIAKTFLNFGYNVDVISYQNDRFIPFKKYAFIIDTRENLQRLAPLLGKDCVKIFHSDTAHLITHDLAEFSRILNLQQRKGITILPRRFHSPNLGADYADYITVLGNQFTIDSFKYAAKPIYRIPISTTTLYPWLEDKNFEASKKSFLWLNSGGMIHKGLDLVLEAFAEMPDYQLTIFGPVNQEEDFERFYHQELYETPNIHLKGWINVESPQFIETVKNCIAIISTSASEGGCGSVITCMHAGLIPIVNYESSVDVRDEYGVLLKGSTVADIQNAVSGLASLPSEQLQRMAYQAWEFARANHTRERFAQEYQRVIEKIMIAQKIQTIHNPQTTDDALISPLRNVGV